MAAHTLFHFCKGFSLTKRYRYGMRKLFTLYTITPFSSFTFTIQTCSVETRCQKSSLNNNNCKTAVKLERMKKVITLDMLFNPSFNTVLIYLYTY